ncbi:complex I subunit 5 family protein [Methanospirillum lacunae]|uniref:Oxidoreductase n=1 Tax=Methanospirillum lacunae TaxID=668570 RepID=A0A2V2N139_9EURY|nr:proton-conducting transporter membrane subunit [Methanospirillum lacunae]PWR72275.1 oxidoreductase [Methanospirillum lacunae]
MLDYYALVPVLLPILGGIILYLLLGFSERIQRSFIVCFMALLFVMNLLYLIALQSGRIDPAAVGPIVLDAPGIFISTLVAFLGTMVLVYSFLYRKNNHFDSTFFILYFVLAGMMCGMACTYNVLVMLVLLEAATVTSAVLILFGRTKRAIRATYIYLAISIFEVILVIYGAFILFSSTGTLDLRFMDISLLSSDDITLLALLFLFGFGTKAGLLPLGSIWLPPAHADAPAAISATMSGILIKASVVAMVKVMYPFFLISNGEMLMFIVTFFGTLNMVLGGVMALFSYHIKRLLAWSSISQIGYIIVGFGLATPVAIYGSLFHILNHMLFKGSLFLISGVLLYQVHTLQIKKMGGLGKAMPLTAISFLIASLAMSGVPFLNGFISKELIYDGSIDAGFPVVFSLLGLHFTIISIFGWITSVVIFVTLMRAFYLIFLGTPRESERELNDPPLYMIIPIVTMVGLCIIIGLFPDLVSGTLQYITQVLFEMRG